MQETNSRLQKALELHQNGKFAAAEIAYRDILSDENADINLYANLIDSLIKQGRGEEALKEIESAIERFPNQFTLQLLLGQTYLLLNKIPQAKQLFLTIKVDHANLAEPHYYLGNIYMHEGQEEAAAVAFEQAIEIKPELSEAHYNLGVIYYQKGEKVRARAKWKAALKHRPNLVQALINLGNLEIEQDHFQEAVTYLNDALQFQPKDYNVHKLIGMAKHRLGQFEEALEHYKVIVQDYPESEEALILVANAYRDLNRFKEAEHYYEKVEKLYPDNKIAKENLQKMRSGRIEGWHYEMLGDLKRNQAYDDVIKRKVGKEDVVLDIGTGSGLLSLMCARAGAKKVYTCENISDIADAAEDVIKENNYEERIKLFNTKSHSLEVGKHLDEKVDVLVSEILDAGLLGEGVIPTLRHARANLIKPDATIIPKSAEVKAVLIESDHIHAILPLKEISGFKLKSFGRFQRSDLYITKQLGITPHTKLTDEQGIFDLDFYNLPKISTPENPNQKELTFTITKEGRLHAIAFWFELDLDEKLRLSSGPGREMIHWGQAVFGFEERKVKKGDLIKIQLLQFETGIEFKLL